MMRALSLLCMVVAIGGAMSAQAPATKPLSPFEQELIANERQFFDALQNKNADYVNHSVSGDFKGIGTNGDFYDKSEVLGGVRAGLPKGFRIYDIVVVRIDGSCAVVSYNEIRPGERARYRHLSDTWSKEDGKWMLKFQQVTPNLWSALDLD